MMRRLFFVVCLGGAISAGLPLCAGAPRRVCEPFPLGDVRLGEGPFMDAFRVNKTYLLDKVEPDRLLSGFRQVAGLPKKADRYRGWESQGVHGQGLGHYLGAVAALYAVTGDPKAKSRVDYIVDELAACQEANGNGYVMTIPQDAVWNRLKAAAKTRAFSCGGHSDHEHFYDVRETPRKLGKDNAETCNVHNLLRLTGRIFTWSPLAERMDWAERALVNQILAQIGIPCLLLPLSDN